MHHSPGIKNYYAAATGRELKINFSRWRLPHPINLARLNVEPYQHLFVCGEKRVPVSEDHVFVKQRADTWRPRRHRQSEIGLIFLAYSTQTRFEIWLTSLFRSRKRVGPGSK